MKTIKLAWKQVIDAASDTPFEKQLFESTFQEFVVQRQSFTRGAAHFTWQEIRDTFPKSNPALPFKVGFAAAGAVQQLNRVMPGLTDTLGVVPFCFGQYRFELLASDSRSAAVHRIAITYYSESMELLEIFGDQLLVSQGLPKTCLVRLIPGLSICQYASTAGNT